MKTTIIISIIICSVQTSFGQPSIENINSTISLVDSPADNIIRYCIRKSEIISKTCKLVSKDRYLQIRGNLINTKGIFAENNRDYYYRPNAGYGFRANSS